MNSSESTLPNTTRLDITDTAATIRLVKQIDPFAIVNAAALTNVDYCETHKAEAVSVNVDGVRNLVEAIDRRNIRFVQISTDFVFDGRFGHYSEDDTPNPINHYGQTKFEAEKIVMNLGNYAIARPSVIYGWNPSRGSLRGSASLKPMNFGMFVADKLRRGEAVKAVRDQYSSPTFADNLADALLRLARLSTNGVFHTAGKSCLSRYEFATKLATSFGFTIGLVKPVFSSEFEQVAERPRYSCLRVEKAEHILGMKFLTAAEGLRSMFEQSSAQRNPA